MLRSFGFAVGSLTPIVALMAVLQGCPGSTSTGDGVGDGDGDIGDGDGDGDTALFDVERVVVDGAEMLAGRGLGVALLDDGRWAAAFMRSGEGQFECQLLGGQMVEAGDYVVTTVALDDGAGGATFEEVEMVPGAASQALDLATDGSQLFLAYGGGETANGYCGSSDLAYATGMPGIFTTSIIATDSGDSASPCLVQEEADPYCDIGDTVGLYPSIAVDDDGTVAIAFQDFHNGFADKDINGSDMEIAVGNGSFSISSVVTEAGAGYHSDVAFGAGGRTIVGHEVLANNQFEDDEGNQYTIQQGLYVAVEQEDGTYLSTLIGDGVSSSSRVAVGYHAAIGWVAAYHDDLSEDLIFWISTDDGGTWTPEPIDRLGLVGRMPAIAFTSDGRPVVAYRYCAGPGEDTCQRATDLVRVAVRDASGDWDSQDMPSFDEQAEGTEITMAAGPNDTFLVGSFTSTTSELVLHKLSLR